MLNGMNTNGKLLNNNLINVYVLDPCTPKLARASGEEYNRWHFLAGYVW